MRDCGSVNEYYCCLFSYQALDAHGVEGSSVDAHSVGGSRSGTGFSVVIVKV
ncbi:hypothetical protein [Ruminococcus albus]|uniref:hypothetical protein n=1 Tax=Ruminococcus albus TaxID=1264 RepID=UPI0012BD27AB|nr:hypothetical protein [Ruminococcus albus]